MSKIRINELARELEVKPNVILDMLPELGVMDKKTHSSSLDDDVALELRRRLAGGNGSAPSISHEPAEPSVEAEEHIAPATAAEPVLPPLVVKTEPVVRTAPAPAPGEAPKATEVPKAGEALKGGEA